MNKTMTDNKIYFEHFNQCVDLALALGLWEYLHQGPTLGPFLFLDFMTSNIFNLVIVYLQGEHDKQIYQRLQITNRLAKYN